MSIPKLLSVPFAKEGRKNIIPNERTPEMAAQLSSYTSGFPAITMQKKEDGGLPPDGMDFNGILYELSDHVVYLNKGGFYKRDESFMSSIGGYPKGVILQADDMNLYVSLADKNTAKFTDKSKWSIIGLVDIKSLLDNKVSSESLAASLELKQDALTFTGTGDVVRKSVTDALDGRVTTAQSSADSALKEAQSKQDKLEFVGSGRVMKEGAGGWLSNSSTPSKYSWQQVSEMNTCTIHGDGSSDVSVTQKWGTGLHVRGISASFRIQATEHGVESLFLNHSKPDTATRYVLLTDMNTRTDKNGVLHASTETVSDTATEAWVKSQIAGSTKKWINVTSQRSLDINYTNNGSHPIYISVMMGLGRDSGLQIFIDDYLLFRQQDTYSSASRSSGFFIVPAGSKYRVSKSNEYDYTIEKWSELR